MTTRTYTDLLALIQGLCGVTFSDIELPRIVALMNRRAMKAYKASDLWPRYLRVGEARAASSDVIPFAEGALDTIGIFLRIHRTQPFASASAQEIVFHIESDGAHMIAGGLSLSSAYVTYKKEYTPAITSASTDIPGEWFYYIAYGTYADFLRAEGQQEKALVADQEAQGELDEELIQAHHVSTANAVFTRINTHSNNQLRQ
jgi:hypothetical protein